MSESAFYRKIIEVLRTDLEENSKIAQFIAWRIKTIYEIIDKFIRDDCPTYAASLAYTSLIALAPLMAVILSAVTAFEGSRSAVLDFIFTKWLPNESLAKSIEANIDTFATNAASVSAFGIFFLALFVIWGMNTIEWSFNMIWKVERSRPLMNKFISYWSAITFAPILLSVSIVASAKLTEAMASDAWKDYGYLHSWALKALPYLLVWIAFFLLYRLIPYTTVHFKPALIGAVVAGTLFEFAKGGFNYYLTQHATYQAVYGAIAVIPIFLFWLYVTWLIVLLGAVIAYAIQYPKEVKISDNERRDRMEFFTYYALRTLIETTRSFEDGQGSAGSVAIHKKLEITGEFFGEIVRALRRAGYVEYIEGSRDRFLLTRPPEKIDVAEAVMKLSGAPFKVAPAPEDHDREKIDDYFKLVKDGVRVGSEGLDLLTLSNREAPDISDQSNVKLKIS